MKRKIGATTIALFLLMACQKKEVLFTKKDVARKTDSAVAQRLPSIKKIMAEDLESRSAIEVKPKADSILQARGIAP